MISQLEEILKDPLSDVARKERRMLLGVSLIAIFIAKTGLIPKKIAALGIELEAINQNALLGIMALVVLYFIVAFVVYGLTDFFVWRLKYNRSFPTPQSENNRQIWQSIVDNNNDGEELSKPFSWLGILPSRHAHLLSVCRIMFEFVLPPLFGVYSIMALLSAIS